MTNGDDKHGWTVETAREALDSRIDYERQIGRERFGFIVAFGALVWFEIQRRLVNLNHEAARIKQAADLSVSLEKFDGYASGMDRRVALLETDQTRLAAAALAEATTTGSRRAERNEVRLNIGTVVAVSGALVAIVTVVILYYAHRATGVPVRTVTVP